MNYLDCEIAEIEQKLRTLRALKAREVLSMSELTGLHGKAFRTMLLHARANGEKGTRNLPAGEPQYVVAGNRITGTPFAHQLNSGAYIWFGQVYYDSLEVCEEAVGKVGGLMERLLSNG